MPHRIIALLADGNIHSGIELGRALGITRSAVGKQVAKLKEMGCQIACIKGAGYRLLMPFEALDAQKIICNLAEYFPDVAPTVEVVWLIASTNDYVASSIKNGKISESGFVCLAEYQSAGRGRRGKHWVSTLGGGLYLSLAWRFEQGAESLEGLSLSVAMAVAEVLEHEFLVKNIKIKWPNDIFLNNKKMGGILIDVMGEAGGPCWVVIGIGLNICNAESVMHAVDQPWIDLAVGVETPLSRNKLAASIVAGTIKKMIAHEHGGFMVTDREWAKYDVFLGKKVVVKMGENDLVCGMSKGISHSGSLLIDVDGVQRVIKSGEVSLRRA